MFENYMKMNTNNNILVITTDSYETHNHVILKH